MKNGKKRTRRAFFDQAAQASVLWAPRVTLNDPSHDEGVAGRREGFAVDFWAWMSIYFLR